MRWPTLIENVLKIVKAATNRAISAKISKRGREERQRLVDRADLLVRDLLTGHDLDAGRQDRGDVLADGGLVRSWPGDDVDRVQLADFVEQALRGRQRERRQGDPGQVVDGAELGDAADRERTRRPGEQNADALTHLEAVLLRGARVHHHVVTGLGRSAGDDAQGRDLGVRVKAHAEGRGAAGRDRVAVTGHELRVALDGSVGGLHPGQAADLREQRLRQFLARGAVTRELRHTADLEIDLRSRCC